MSKETPVRKFSPEVRSRAVRMADFTYVPLRGHLKSGEWGTPQNQPTEGGHGGTLNCMITGIQVSSTEPLAFWP